MTTNTNTVITRIIDNPFQYDVFLPINISPCAPLITTVSQVTPTVLSLSPSNEKYNIIINVLYSIVINYRSVDGKLIEISRYYKVAIPDPDYTVNTSVTISSIGSPKIIKGHLINVKLRFNITN